MTTRRLVITIWRVSIESTRSRLVIVSRWRAVGRREHRRTRAHGVELGGVSCVPHAESLRFQPAALERRRQVTKPR
jgi:hypothetical protein